MKLKEFMERRQQGEWLTLRVKPVDTEILLREGNYPESLMEIIGKHVYGDGKSESDYLKEMVAGGAQKMRQNALENREWAEVLAENAILEPMVVREGETDIEKGVIALRDLETPDCYFLSNLINLPLSRLRPFCLEQNEAMERLLNGEGILPVTQSDSEPEGNNSLPDAPDGDMPTVSVERSNHDHQRVADHLPV